MFSFETTVILSNFIGNDGAHLPSQHLGDSRIAVPTVEKIPQMDSIIDGGITIEPKTKKKQNKL